MQVPQRKDMTYRLLLFSEEVENFVMEILVPPSATFHQLHRLILSECGYTERGNHRFLICDEAWKVREKIHLHDSGKTSYDEDLYLMEDTALEDFMEDDGRHIAYVYDTEAKSTFLLDLVETLFGEECDKAYVRRRKGMPPAQFEESYAIQPMESITAPVSPAADTEKDDTVDDDSFSEDELDAEGFEVSEM